MDPNQVRDTEARIYLGSDALEIGLIDELGTEDDVTDRIENLIDAEPEIREFEPKRGLAERLSIGTERVAFAAGSGVASVFTSDGGDIDVELK